MQHLQCFPAPAITSSYLRVSDLMKFVNPLPFVADIDRSKRFYSEVLGLHVLEDLGDFVRFENGFALHDAVSLHLTIFGKVPDESIL